MDLTKELKRSAFSLFFTDALLNRRDKGDKTGNWLSLGIVGIKVGLSSPLHRMLKVLFVVKTKVF